MEKRKIPAVRFKGFEDDWEQRKLEELSEFITKGATPTTYGFEWQASGIPFFRNDAIKNNQFVYGDYSYISEEANEALQRSEVHANDILVAITGDIGKVGIIPKNIERGNINQHIARVRITKDAVPYFIYQSLCTGRQQRKYQLIKTGLSMPQLSLEQIRKTVVLCPSLSEQVKIGEYFSNLDHLITLHQRKLKKLQLVKKSMLEKMFPKNGSKIPEIRFEGFTDDWEQRKLGELISEYKETVDSSCTLPVLTSSKTEGVILQEEHFGRKQQHDITGYNVLPRSYCTYRNRSDGVDFTFNVNECCDMGIISKFYPVFCGNDNDTYFLSLVLNNSDEVVHEIAYTCTGTGQKVLSFLDLQKMSIRVPRHDEQKKISAYFKQLNYLITLHQRKLEKMKNIKKSLLKKFFAQ